MKFQTIHSFRAQPVSRLSIIAAPWEFDRRRIREQMVSELEKLHGKIKTITYPNLSILVQEEAYEALFKSVKLLVVELEEDLEVLEQTVRHFIGRAAEHSYLLLYSKEAKPWLNALYATFKKEAVFLDLSGEKPWDRERRWREGWMECMRRGCGGIQEGAFRKIWEHSAGNPDLIEGEIQKCLVYVKGERPITEKDVDQLLVHYAGDSPWQAAERVVWESGLLSSLEEWSEGDQSFILLNRIRFHLELGWQMAYHLEKRGINQVNWVELFPNLSPKQLKRYLPVAEARTVRFFQRNWRYLFDLELQMKGGLPSLRSALDLFLHKIKHEEKTPTSSQ